MILALPDVKILLSLILDIRLAAHRGTVDRDVENVDEIWKILQDVTSSEEKVFFLSFFFKERYEKFIKC